MRERDQKNAINRAFKGFLSFILFFGSIGMAYAGGPTWAWEEGGYEHDGSVTLGDNDYYVNPTGIRSLADKSVRQPPTVIMQKNNENSTTVISRAISGYNNDDYASGLLDSNLIYQIASSTQLNVKNISGGSGSRTKDFTVYPFGATAKSSMIRIIDTEYVLQFTGSKCRLFKMLDYTDSGTVSFVYLKDITVPGILTKGFKCQYMKMIDEGIYHYILQDCYDRNLIYSVVFQVGDDDVTILNYHYLNSGGSHYHTVCHFDDKTFFWIWGDNDYIYLRGIHIENDYTQTYDSKGIGDVVNSKHFDGITEKGVLYNDREYAFDLNSNKIEGISHAYQILGLEKNPYITLFSTYFQCTIEGGVHVSGGNHASQSGISYKSPDGELFIGSNTLSFGGDTLLSDSYKNVALMAKDGDTVFVVVQLY